MANEKRLMCVENFKKNLCHYCNTYMSEEPCEPGECWVHDVIAQTNTVDAVEVVYCDECSNHNNCIPENTFRLLRIEKPFCCVGSRKTNCFGAKMDGDGNG